MVFGTGQVGCASRPPGRTRCGGAGGLPPSAGGAGRGVEWRAADATDPGAAAAAAAAGASVVYLPHKEMHEALAGLVADGRTSPRGAPKHPLQLGATIWHFRHESRVTSPPIWAQDSICVIFRSRT